MKRTACILALTFGCLMQCEVRSADKPITLALEQTTTLHVNQAALLRMPSNPRYSQSGIGGAWQDALVRVRGSRTAVVFRAVQPGVGVIIVSPDVRNGECI